MTHVRSRTEEAYMSRQLIIGLGTGRCGTVSLCSFLNTQPSTRVIHEGAIGGERHLFNWTGDSAGVIAWLKELASRANGSYYGDIAFYYLPYAEAILAKWPTAKFVVLKRDRDSTIASYLRKTDKRNHWMEHNGSKWLRDRKWDPKYPKFKTATKEAAIGYYWDMYYQRVAELIAVYPGAFALYELSTLNSPVRRRAVLRFLGYESDTMVVDGSFRENASEDGAQRESVRRRVKSGLLRLARPYSA